MAYHFNNRIEIIREEQAPEDDFFPSGNSEKIEKVIANPWCEVKTMKGNEFVGAGTVINEVPIRFIIRYRQGIDTAQLVKYKGRKYNIKSIANDDGKNETITIFATMIEL